MRSIIRVAKFKQLCVDAESMGKWPILILLAFGDHHNPMLFAILKAFLEANLIQPATITLRNSKEILGGRSLRMLFREVVDSASHGSLSNPKEILGCWIPANTFQRACGFSQPRSIEGVRGAWNWLHHCNACRGERS